MATQILVVEDDTRIRENVKEMLTLHGFQIETATNGREGISQALLQPPDLILCDIMMPEVDGYQVLEVVRNNRLIANVPFIFLTALTEPTQIRKGMVEGADDYLTKPFTLQNLLHTVNSRLKREALRKAELKAQLDSYRHNLASVSVHEYNTALTGIIGFSAMLMNQDQPLGEADTVLMARMINVCGQRLKRSLDNVQLLDVLQQLDVNDKSYVHYCGGSSPITTQLVIGIAKAIEQRQDRQVPYQLAIDRAQVGLPEISLSICLVELIDNAIKFSDPGQSVMIRGEVVGSTYQITVSNQGQPFKAEDMDQIAPYKQFNRRMYEQQGFGLGLAIVKQIVEFNRGQLTISSPSAGLTMATIQLPRMGE